MAYTLGYIADYLEAELVSASTASGVRELPIQGISHPATAVADEITFIAAKNYLDYLGLTSACAVIINRDYADACPVNKIIVDDAYAAYAHLTKLFAQQPSEPSIHPSAVIADTAVLADQVSIAANVVIGENAEIAENTIIGAGSIIGDGVKLGARSEIKAKVSLYHDVQIGADCIIHSGAIIGSDGFGFAPSSAGYIKIYQLGKVVIGDQVEIGANTSIDRGALGDTEIHDGVKIDNLVHIAHNCIIGEGTAIAAQVGMAGTTKIGKRCTFGGQVGLAGHLEIADDVRVSGKSMVTKSISKSGSYSSGTGFSDSSSWRKNAVRFNQLDELAKRIAQLEKINNKN